MVKMIVPKKDATAISLNMRNSQFTPAAFKWLTDCLGNDKCYVQALNLRFCFLDLQPSYENELLTQCFTDFILLANSVRFNKTLIKLDLSNNVLKSCTVKFLISALDNNFYMTDLNLANNFLDDEFAVDLAHLLEDNQVMHTVDISNNPIGPQGAQYLLSSLLQYNDTLESLGDIDKNMYMGVRNREEIKQILSLN